MERAYPRRLIIFLLQFIFIYFKTVLWIRILWIGSGYGSGSSISSEFGSGSGPGYFWSKIKNTAENFFPFFWSKITIFLSLDLLKSRPIQRRSLQPSKENIQYFKKLNFIFFLVIFVRLDPDPDTIRLRVPYPQNLLYRHRSVTKLSNEKFRILIRMQIFRLRIL